MANLPEDVVRLIKIYQQAQSDLIKTISEKEATGSVPRYQRELLRQVNQVLAELNGKAGDWVKEVIPKNYQKGIDDVIAVAPESFAKLHEGAVKILASNTSQDLIDANTFVGRQIRDAVRQAGIYAISNKIATGSTVKQAKQNLINKLVDQGLNGIKDKRGRMINLSAYAETVARSTTREATNRATMNQLTYNGHDLVKMSSHATTCKICAPLQGRVYSISGKDSRFPPLTRAYSGVHANIHPNCRHVLMPYIEELADDVSVDIENSNRSFDVDERTQKQVDAYNNTQAKKRQLRNNRRQFERYRMTLPGEAPKTFQGFMSMKRADSDNWKQLQEKYRKVRKNSV